MVANLHKSKVWMRKKYIVERLSEQEIADLAGVNQATINRWLKRHGLQHGGRL